ncbi:MAG TPA: hypothetical protein HA362_05555 [Nanoarchaeota archaeon]|nr:hypothetical protein [Nanoarchaeota archaeon]
MKQALAKIVLESVSCAAYNNLSPEAQGYLATLNNYYTQVRPNTKKSERDSRLGQIKHYITLQYEASTEKLVKFPNLGKYVRYARTAAAAASVSIICLPFSVPLATVGAISFITFIGLQRALNRNRREIMNEETARALAADEQEYAPAREVLAKSGLSDLEAVLRQNEQGIRSQIFDYFSQN